MPRRSPIRPPALRSGDVVGIVAPGSAIDAPSLRAGCEELKRLGYRPYHLDSILDTHFGFAGTVERRISELEHMFANPDVRTVLCARGGYGCNHLLPKLDVDRVLANPKPFIGYSDVTTLLTWFTDHGLVTFHGPMAAKDFTKRDGADPASWNAALGDESSWEGRFDPARVQVLVEGDAEGVLYGGCLSLVAASLGTPYEVQTEDTILLLEDVNEPSYRVDRMLMQLKLAGKFEGVRGVLLGEMPGCDVEKGAPYTFRDVLLRLLGDLGIPVVFGVPAGHVRGPNMTFPIGVRAKVKASNEVRLEVAPAVTAR